VLLGGGPPGLVSVTRCDSLKIWPLRCALCVTCPSWLPAPAWPTSWLDQKHVRRGVTHHRYATPVTLTQAGADVDRARERTTGQCPCWQKSSTPSSVSTPTAGTVRLTGWGVRLPGGGGSDWFRGCHAVVVVQGAPLPSGDHQPLCVAVPPVLAELAGDRGTDDGSWCPGHLRNHPSVVPQVRSGLREPATSPSAPAGR